MTYNKFKEGDRIVWLDGLEQAFNRSIYGRITHVHEELTGIPGLYNVKMDCGQSWMGICERTVVLEEAYHSKLWRALE